MRLRALCLLREQVQYRRKAFCDGLEAAGFELVDQLTTPKPCDVVVIWNRYDWWDREAKRFEHAGAKVLVVENGYLGNEFAGAKWYAISRSQHNGAGCWPDGGSERWDSLGIELAPWREDGRRITVLPQRGIGPPGVAMPAGWTDTVRHRLESKGALYKVREHPGQNACVPLEDDLADAKAVVTWGSGAALKALLLGIPVIYEFEKWIGAPAASPWGAPLFHGDRLPMLRRLAWAMWRLDEIASGEAIKALCEF